MNHNDYLNANKDLIENAVNYLKENEKEFIDECVAKNVYWRKFFGGWRENGLDLQLHDEKLWDKMVSIKKKLNISYSLLGESLNIVRGLRKEVSVG